MAIAVLSVTGHLLWPQQVPTAPARPPLPTPVPLAPHVLENEPVREQSITVTFRGGETRRGLVLEPEGPPPETGRPALVLVAGAGSASPDEQRTHARALAAQGLTVLVYDKRTAGYGVVRRDFDVLAEDAAAAVERLRGWAGVAPDRVGLLGISEGSWVVPLAATQVPTAFVVLAVAPVVSPGEQLQWLLDSGLTRQAAPAGARAAVASALATRWPGSFLAYARHDPVPPLHRVGVPVLGIFGSADRAIPVEDSVRRLLAAADDSTAVVLDGADHGLRGPDGELRRDYVSALVGWLGELPGPAPQDRSRTWGVPAVQPHAAAAQPPSPAGDGALVLVATTAVAAGALVGPVAARRARWKPGGQIPRVPIVRRLRWTAMGVAGALNLGLAGLVGVALVGGGPVATGGIWLLMRGAGVAVVALGVQVARAPMPPDRASRAERVGALVAGGAAAVLAARLGVFRLGW